MKLKLRIWRQAGPNAPGRLVDYAADDVSTDMSFLEMLDVVNEGLVKQGQDASKAMLVAAQSGDTAGYQASLKALGGLCGQCHMKYREDTD